MVSSPLLVWFLRVLMQQRVLVGSSTAIQDRQTAQSESPLANEGGKGGVVWHLLVSPVGSAVSLYQNSEWEVNPTWPEL